jgi:hypothetical protein
MTEQVLTRFCFLLEVFTTNYLFDGAQANIVKELSGNFHVQHQFSLGSQVMPPMYNFMSGYMTERVKYFLERGSKE